MLRADADPVRATLSASFGPSSVWSGLFDSLTRLQRHAEALSGLPSPCQASVSEWCEFVLADHLRWKALVKRHSCPDPPCSVKKAQTSADAQVFEVHFVCEACGFPAKSAAGLAMHKRRKHDIEAPLSLLVRSAKCVACGLVAANRDRALDHLKQSKRCRTYTEAQIEPMSREELIAVREREFGADYTWSRPIAPKPGPKPPGERPPLNGILPLFQDEQHAQAAVLLS
eukprot:4060588-Amphidinium_carterae.1